MPLRGIFLDRLDKHITSDKDNDALSGHKVSPNFKQSTPQICSVRGN